MTDPAHARIAKPVDFAFVSAKLRGMRSKIYERERLDALTSLHNVYEMMAAVYPRMEIGSRVRFEGVLVEDHVRDLDRVRVYLVGLNREFFDWQLERYRIENLKVLLRGWLAAEPIEGVLPHVVELPRGYGLAVEEILRCGRLTEVVRLLPDRRFVEGVRRGAVPFHDTQKLYFIEAGLDQVYYEELCRRARVLSGQDRDEACRLVATEVLIYNVLFAMRARTNYDVPADDVREFLVTRPDPAPPTAAFDAMLGAKGFGPMLAQAPGLAALLGKTSVADLGELQRRLWERLFARANAVFYRSLFHLGCLEAFYYVKRVELNNLIRIAEMLRLGSTSSEIQGELIRMPE